MNFCKINALLCPVFANQVTYVGMHQRPNTDEKLIGLAYLYTYVYVIKTYIFVHVKLVRILTLYS